MYDFVKYTKDEGPHKFFTLSFDDGITQDRRFVGLLNKYGLKCTFNLNSGLLGQSGRLESSSYSVDHTKIPPEEVASLYSGHEIAVHTVNHPRLDKMTSDEVYREVCDDLVALEKLSGQKIFGMAYPYGPAFTDETLRVISEETPIKYSRSTTGHKTFAMPENLIVWEPTCHSETGSLFKLADEFLALKPESDALFYVWGHSYEFDIYDSWDRIEEFFAKISGKSDICYATNGEIADYIIRNINQEK